MGSQGAPWAPAVGAMTSMCWGVGDGGLVDGRLGADLCTQEVWDLGALEDPF